MKMYKTSVAGKEGVSSTRKRITLIALVVAILFVAWLAMPLFSTGTATSPAIAPITPPSTAKTNAPTAAPAPGATTATAAPNAASTPEPGAILLQKPVQQRPEIAKIETETQNKYIDSLTQLQMLKVQKDIAETNQAIASAKLATVTSEKGIEQLTTPPPPTLGGVAFTPGGPNVPVPPTEVSYTVISVSMQQNRWNAVIGAAGKLYSVSVGDTLPPDGSEVVSISKDGVVVKKGGKEKKLSLTSLI